MSHPERIENKKSKILEIAHKIIYKEIDIIEGCRRISSLWFEADFPEDDSCNFFELIDSETDTFPKGKLRAICSEAYLREQDKKEKKYLEHFEKDIIEECQSLIEKYGK